MSLIQQSFILHILVSHQSTNNEQHQSHLHLHLHLHPSVITVRLPRLNPSSRWLTQVHPIPVFVLVLVFYRARLAK